MRLIVSKCLLGENCKYSGGNNYNEAVVRFCENHEVIGICPECFGGLPTPRKPSEIRLCNEKKTVFSSDGKEVTEQFENGAEMALQLAKETDAELCILKESSPSCGVNNIYDGTFSGVKVSGMGISAELLAAHGFKVVSEYDIQQLAKK